MFIGSASEAPVFELLIVSADDTGAVRSDALATGLSLLVWFIYAPQCLSTWATIKRETNSWKLMALNAGYLFALAYLASLLTYQVAAALGAG